jgi:hypothetical protein
VEEIILVKSYPLLKFQIITVPSDPAVVNLNCFESKHPAVILVLDPGGPCVFPNFDIRCPSSMSHTAMNPPSSADTTVSNYPLLRANATGNSCDVLISS